jgi:hypothetical protein
MLNMLVELLLIAGVWAALTWRAQSSGEMSLFGVPLMYLRKSKSPGAFTALLALRWLQVAGLVVVAALFSIGVLPLR